ncbi:PIN domain-like protein [Hymenopellis radicata]|nr:PIN domain-like protein [Hymenopellis radicata]
MGIPGLYDELQSTARLVSLHEMSAIEGFVAQRRERGCIIMGIDACLWIQQILHGRNMQHLHKGSNPEMKELFRRLSKLLNYAVVPVFVFDGPDRPKFKRGRKVVHSPGSLVEGFQELIEAFGFYSLTARGEAEAELAILNVRKLIDVVITEDSDALVFGTCVLGRGLDIKARCPSVMIYSRNHINEDLGISPGGLFLFALLVGGDYDGNGLRGCGKRIAAGLARTPLGDDLRDAFHRLSPTDFADFCVAWRQVLACELRTNASGMLPSCFAALADNIPDTFPMYTVVQLYAAPLVTETWDSVDFVPRAPDLNSVMALYTRYILPKPEAVSKFLHQYLVPGYFSKLLHLSAYSPEMFLSIGNKRLTAEAASASFSLVEVTIDKNQVFRVDAFASLKAAPFRRYTIIMPDIVVYHTLPGLMAHPPSLTGHIPVLPILRSFAPLEYDDNEGDANEGDVVDTHSGAGGGTDNAPAAPIVTAEVIDILDDEEDVVPNQSATLPQVIPIEVIDISDDDGDIALNHGTVAVEVIDISDDERDVATDQSATLPQIVLVEVIDISDDEGEVVMRQLSAVEVIDISEDERDVIMGQPAAVEVIDISDNERDIVTGQPTVVEFIDIFDDEGDLAMRQLSAVEAMDIS